MATTNKFERINRWLTLGANIGVVLGLIILIVELRQNASLTRMQLESDFIVGTQLLELKRSDPNFARVWVKSVQEPHNLNPMEVTMLDGFLTSQVQQWWLLLQMSEQGLVTKKRVQNAVANEAPYFFGNAFSQHWWSLEGSGWNGTGVVDLVDPIIKEIDPAFNVGRFDLLRMEPPGGGEAATQKMQTDPVVASPDLYRVLFENQHIRVVEYAIAPGEHDNPHTHPPKFMVVLASGRLKIDIGNGETIISEEETGAAKWTAARGLHTAENIGDTTVRVLLVEPKSAQATEGVAP